MKEILYPLIIWISATTGWEIPTNIPAAAMMNPEISARLGGMASTSYVPSIGEYGTIFTRPNSGENDIIHELVHFFQRYQQRDAKTAKEECLFELEAEHIENLWQKEHGLMESKPYQELCGKFIPTPSRNTP